MKKLFISVICFCLIATSCSKKTETSSTASQTKPESTAIESTSDTTSSEISEESATTTTADDSEKLINPSEEYVISCLKSVEQVDKIEAATEDHDPNNNLHKQGGYTSAVYFTITSIEVKKGSDGGYVAVVNGEEQYLVLDENESADSPVDLGTDCGGQIEVYATVKDAERRNEYLSSFDGGAFSSGSHYILGSMVIRTSSNLRASQQQELTEQLIAALENG